MPREYNQNDADKVCELIMDGYSLRKIEAVEGMPRRLDILRWLRENKEFQTQYAHAREEQADVLADEILEISDDKLGDFKFDPENGLVVDGDHIQRAKLRVDSRKWIAGKLKPKKYGDSTQIKHADADGNKLTVSSILHEISGTSSGLPSPEGKAE